MDNFTLIKNIDELYNSSIIIFGAGKQGIKLAELLLSEEIEILFFCDNDPEKCNTNIRVLTKEYVIYDIDAIRNIDTYKKVRIIISPRASVEIDRQLMQLNIYNAWDCFGVQMAYILNRENKKISDKLKQKIKFEFAEKLKYVRETPKIRHHELFDRINANNITHLVYQPGKTGSSTIYKSLRQLGIYTEHLHTLNHPEWCLGTCLNDEWNMWKKRFVESNDEKKILIGIREPISRDLSAYFQGYQEGVWRIYGMPNFINDMQKSYESFIEMIYKGREFAYEKMGAYRDNICINEFDWFDYEIKNNFRIDIYDYPFDKEKGFSIIEKDNIKIFIYTVEKLSGLEDELKRFLDNKQFELVKDNAAKEKDYYSTYCEAKKKLKIPKEYFDNYYVNNSRYKHFYSEEEIDAFRINWINNVF